MYDVGQGVPQDYPAAAKWYKLAAKEESSQASKNHDIFCFNSFLSSVIRFKRGQNK